MAAMHLEQVQRFILVKKIFWGYGHFKNVLAKVLMWLGFDSQTRRHMWVEFVGSLLCIERFSPGTPVSSLLKNKKN